VQELEQEKYHLRRRLEVAEEEYDLKVVELQSDINNLRQMLEVRRGGRAPGRHQQPQADAGGKERWSSSR
jgi:hypothetical protein